MNNKLDRFIKYFPLIMTVIISLLCISITYYSDNIKLDEPNYKNIETFIKIYKTPLQLFLISLTVWGILIAYNTYLQTKDMFIKQNRPWVSAGNKIKHIETKDNLILSIDLLNTGNTPAFKLNSDISYTTNGYNRKVIGLKKTEITLFPKGIVSEFFEIDKRILNPKKPIIKISSDITYFGIDNIQKSTKGNYEYNYLKNETTNLGEVCT
ncbi:MAG: hypothetical protein H8E55_73280 [Pelagibacterales bacterium]|nr:hypothetical protein [Pelagibacterales bacterium]